MSKEKYETEVNETLEMSTIIDWDDDDFFDTENSQEDKKETKDFDEDSFWENYDFDSMLDSQKK